MARIDLRPVRTKHLDHIQLPAHIQDPYLRNLADWAQRDVIWNMESQTAFQTDTDGLNIIVQPFILRLCPQKVREIYAPLFEHDQALVLTFLVVEVGVEHLAHYQVIILRNRVARVHGFFAEHGRHKN